MKWEEKVSKIKEVAQQEGLFCKEERFPDGGKRLIIREKREEVKNGKG